MEELGRSRKVERVMYRVQALTSDPESPAKARSLVRAELAGCQEEAVAATELMVSELVTNAVVHGATPIRIELEHDDNIVRAAVTDGGAELPVLRTAQASATHGRGLKIVSSLADDWGIVEDETGKLVWFSLPCR